MYLNHLALLLQETNRVEETKPLMRRVLAITPNTRKSPCPRWMIGKGNGKESPGDGEAEAD